MREHRIGRLLGKLGGRTVVHIPAEQQLEIFRRLRPTGPQVVGKAQP